MAAAYLRALALFADFDGRASRAEYWGFLAVHGAVSLALVGASAVVGEVAGLAWVVGGAVAALYLAVTFFPVLSATARRLHDTGRSSLWVAVALVPFLVPLLAVWLAAPGDPAPNGWGQPPGVEGR